MTATISTCQAKYGIGDCQELHSLQRDISNPQNNMLETVCTCQVIIIKPAEKVVG